MGTSVVRFKQQGAVSWGVLNNQQVFPLSLEPTHHRDLMKVYFENRAEFDAAIAGEPIEVAAKDFVAPLDENIQLFAQGLNYQSHRDETGVGDGEDSENLIFLKGASTLCGPNDDILRPKNCELLDYEIEMGVVLKKDIHQTVEITDANLGAYLGGIILTNDVSARDFMFGAPMIQWYKGKTQKTFCPAGPVLYLLDEGDADKIYDLDLKLWMNGELKQDSNTNQLIHKPSKTLTELSTFTKVNAGDCILTGTPGGVLLQTGLKTGLAIILNLTNDKKRRAKLIAAQKGSVKFLQAGDVLELEIKSSDGSIDLGKQRNVIAEA